MGAALRRILKAVRAAAEEPSLLNLEITRSVINRLCMLGDRVNPRVALLTTGEREVLCLVAEGMTNTEIGNTLFVTEHAASATGSHGSSRGLASRT